MTEIKINNLYFKYGFKNSIYKDFSLTIGEGITLLLGANGSGKSTLFKLICGVLLPTKGSIELYTEGELVKFSEMKSKIAYIPQDFELFPSFTVREVLTYICGARDKALSKAEIKDQVKRAIALADIEKYADSKMRTLSGGTRQRVGIAQSILGNPSFIIADEPTAGLDPKQRERYHSIVRKTAENRSFLISTHLYEDVEYYDNVIVISNGELKFQGTKDELISSVPSADGSQTDLKEAWLYYIGEEADD